MAILLGPAPEIPNLRADVLTCVQRYPRLRFMGSKYRVVPYLVRLFEELSFETALDAFSGSGVVAYALKAMGKQVTANDFLAFPAVVARATIQNSHVRLGAADVDYMLSPNEDSRDFIQRTFQGLYFPAEDLAFLDAAWSHVDRLEGPKRDLAIASLILAAARKQPRGVFTVTDLRYDDGRRYLRMPLRELFVESVSAYNTAVFDNGRDNHVLRSDIFDLTSTSYDIVYLDPPYAPPTDDSDYIKRYHFLEGLAVYWQGCEILENTLTKKIRKRYTPFAYKKSIRRALADAFDKFRESTIVLSYSSNSVPGEHEIFELLRHVKDTVDVYAISHRYSFGTHAAAQRREAHEYVFVAR